MLQDLDGFGGTRRDILNTDGENYHASERSIKNQTAFID